MCCLWSGAREYFFSWWTGKGEFINRIKDDAQGDSREMKRPAQVARLAPAHTDAAACFRRETPAICGLGIGESRCPAERLFR